jgi:hypothetical protein
MAENTNPGTPKAVNLDDDAGFAKLYERRAAERTKEPDNLDAGGDTESDGPTFINSIPVVGAADISDGGTGGDSFGVRRKRGRPRGSANTQKAQPKSNLVADLESLLISGHFMLAGVLDMKELEIDEIEAKRLSEALTKLSEFYPVGMSPKKMAWINLSMALGSIYGPRAVAIAKKVPKKKPAPLRVMNTPPAQAAVNETPLPQAQEQPVTAQRPRVPSDLWNQDGIESESE